MDAFEYIEQPIGLRLRDVRVIDGEAQLVEEVASRPPSHAVTSHFEEGHGFAVRQKILERWENGGIGPAL